MPPPPGGQPPSNPPGGGMPPPPGGGGGAYNPPPAQPYGGGYGGGQQLEVGAAISYGWQKFQQYWQQFVLLMLGVFIAIIIAYAVAFLLLVPAISGDSVFLSLIGGAFAFALVFVVGLATQAGIYRAGLAVTRGEAPTVSMFTESTNIGPFLLTILLVGIGTGILALFCYIPGIIFAFFTVFAPLRALERGEGPVDAIKGSFEMVQTNLGQVLLVVLVSYLVYYVGALACGIGLLVTAPIALIAICWSYRVINGEPIAP